MTNTFDAIVIGAGSGGLTAAVGLSRFGKRVALIERGNVGGDCTNVGCIPSKSLLHHSAHPGERTPGELLATVRERRNYLRDHETIEFGEMEGITLISGRAHLVAAGEVEVETNEGLRRLTSSHVVIATGSRPRRIPVDGLPDDRYLTNDELFEMVDPPRRLVIIGAGPIGMEMAVAFRRMGSEVSVLDAATQILPAMLPEGAAVVARSLAAAGVDLQPGMVAIEFEPSTNSLAIGPPGGPIAGEIPDVDKVLVAVGRVPNSEDLGLDRLGIETDGAGRIVIDAKGQTSMKAVWATGDVTIEGATTHAANAWGRRIIKHIVAPVAPAGDRPLHPAVTYTSPEAATIGEQPIDVPDDVRRISFDLADADRAFTDEVKDGVIIVDVRRFSGTVLGATIVGPRAGELISIFSLAMKAGIPLHKWYGTVWPYPSYADAIGAVVDEYMGEALSTVRQDAASWAKGTVRRLRRR